MEQEQEIKHLEWDSNFFGYKTGIVTLNSNLISKGIQKIVSEGKEKKYKLIYLVNADKTLKFENFRNNYFEILLTDKKVTYNKFLPSYLNHNIPPHISLYTQSLPNKELLSLAIQSGVYSRFATDPNFENGEFEKLYETWIKKSVSNEIAKEVWVSVNEDGLVSGFITIGLKNNTPDIGLLAVNTEDRGKNIGKGLIQTACARAALWGMNNIQVVTQQDNINACQFYKKAGFRLEKIEYIYHIWLKNNDTI